MTLPTDTQLEAIHAGLSALTSHQRIKRAGWLTAPRQCSATVEHASGLRGKQCTYAASHEIEGQHLCWTHAKIMTRNRGTDERIDIANQRIDSLNDLDKRLSHLETDGK